MRGLSLVAYALLVGSAFTPLYLPFEAGRDDTWAILLLVVAAHVGVALVVRRAWVLGLPVLACLAAFVAGGGEGSDWLSLILALPALLVLTAGGWFAGRRAGARATLPAAAWFAVGAAVPGWAALEHLRRGEHVAPEVQRALPTELSLGNLCPHSSTPGELRRDLRRSADLLLRELDRRPHDLVTYTFHPADEPPERRRITVRELAEEQLQALDDGGPDCAPELAQRLRAGLG